MMRNIPSMTHGVLDYLVGLVLIVAPWLFNFSSISIACYISILVGSVIIIYSLQTNYELGVVKVIPMQTHLILDLTVGAVLALSPWFFNFRQSVYLPHLVVGILIIGVS